FDSESYTYCYSFSESLLEEWNWRERFAAQPEVLEYLRHVTDRFGLRRDIRFGTAVTTARFDEGDNAWVVMTDDGGQTRATYLISAAGALSAHQLPDIEGIGDFEGLSCHTARWPEDGVDFAGKRVGVIGTGATGVQVIQTIASDVAHLTVFQRTANYCVPQRNAPLSDDERRDIRQRYPEILATCRASYGGFIHTFDPR